jgi:hypothetical protein
MRVSMQYVYYTVPYVYVLRLLSISISMQYVCLAAQSQTLYP